MSGSDEDKGDHDAYLEKMKREGKQRQDEDDDDDDDSSGGFCTCSFFITIARRRVSLVLMH